MPIMIHTYLTFSNKSMKNAIPYLPFGPKGSQFLAKVTLTIVRHFGNPLVFKISTKLIFPSKLKQLRHVFTSFAV